MNICLTILPTIAGQEAHPQKHLHPVQNSMASKAYRTAMLGEMLHQFYTEVVHE